jgi:O-antigen/teichoic acid export membrane protein
VALLLFLSAGLWGNFFKDPRVAEVVQILSVGFIFIPFGSIPEALLVRSYEVIQLAKVAAVTIVFYFSISLTLAMSGYSYTTMAWANLGNIVVSGLAYRFFLLKPIPWMPSFKGWRLIAKFGFGSILTSLLKVIENALPDIVLGRASGAASVGLYSRANATVNLVSIGVTPTINFFALPYLSGIHHRNLQMGVEFLRVGSIINSLLIPPLVWIGIMAPEIVELLFGSQWQESVPLIPWICAAVGISTLFTLTIPALQGVGKPYIFAVPLFFTVLAKGLAIWLVFDGTIVSFAQGVLIGQLVMLPIYVYINKLYLAVSVRQWLIDILFQGLILFISGLALWVVNLYWLADFQSFSKVIGSAAFFGTIYFALILVSNLPVQSELKNVFSVIRSKI